MNIGSVLHIKSGTFSAITIILNDLGNSKYELLHGNEIIKTFIYKSESDYVLKREEESSQEYLFPEYCITFHTSKTNICLFEIYQFTDQKGDTYDSLIGLQFEEAARFLFNKYSNLFSKEERKLLHHEISQWTQRDLLYTEIGKDMVFLKSNTTVSLTFNEA